MMSREERTSTLISLILAFLTVAFQHERPLSTLEREQIFLQEKQIIAGGGGLAEEGEDKGGVGCSLHNLEINILAPLGSAL